MKRNNKNILVTSISKKVPLLKAVKQAIHKFNPAQSLYGADIENDVIGRFFVDEFWEMPKLNEISIDDFIYYCTSNNISYVIPTRDGELKFFSQNKNKLVEHGIYTMVSQIQAVEACLDKLCFFKTLIKYSFPVIPTYQTVDELSSHTQVVVKERFGAGSKSIGINLSIKDAIEHSELLNFPIFQPMIEGIEVSVDLYLDKWGKTKGVISRTRDKVVNGESQMTKTKCIPELEKTCSDVAEKLKLYGHVIFQVIVDRQNKFHIIECNCRFGGASTLSLAAGLDSFYWFLLESKGNDLANFPFERNTKELSLVRYPQDYIY
ncbi:ATP-grasp domain-containing protein [Bacillus sp. FJAT-29790]|uniref:ATP-grasp domain-containing protein n=1 Tax=Bacillus sp. FJAT-29790 TaxID=1895002 RepID=UPI001C22F4C7|nr:ATP-grasp domain-containing protein [Bacillus sp. FJAT-29790]MBU8881195.1 ATP-grasp domain-containing protein [Bacillus sp. FJAT-29790]